MTEKARLIVEHCAYDTWFVLQEISLCEVFDDRTILFLIEAIVARGMYFDGGRSFVIHRIRLRVFSDPSSLSWCSDDYAALLAFDHHDGIDCWVGVVWKRSVHSSFVEKTEPISPHQYLIDRADDVVHALREYLAEKGVASVSTLEASTFLSRYFELTTFRHSGRGLAYMSNVWREFRRQNILVFSKNDKSQSHVSVPGLQHES